MNTDIEVLKFHLMCLRGVKFDRKEKVEKINKALCAQTQLK